MHILVESKDGRRKSRQKRKPLDYEKESSSAKLLSPQAPQDNFCRDGNVRDLLRRNNRVICKFIQNLNILWIGFGSSPHRRVQLQLGGGFPPAVKEVCELAVKELCLVVSRLP